ncbi:hypothetical protein SAMN05216184_1269 [Georgenia satyanarayanai]|uniref:Uncharacterized protein n=1 Tax=Georgenia satyanarayanai TaxID=860221 RepID=A0A2Y9C7Z5_9MICO|nr:hypothetical protein A8987_1269 [Georgenia satyanarayanai]SSA47313.1 hypothetical protein SAMN05216184_1269 [Georgenia satyanarayanai]
MLVICLGFMALGLWAISVLFPGDATGNQPPDRLAERTATKETTRSG